MALAGYNVKKAAQVVAFFALKEGESINVLKLAKLLYLAERAYIEKYDMPMLFDNCVSMPHGPVLSLTQNYVDGYKEDADNWDVYISGKSNHEVGLTDNQLNLDALDELSRATLKILETIWSTFGHMGKYEIRDYTHQHCPEWDDPDGSSNPIPYVHLLKFLGKEHAVEISEEIESLRHIPQFA